MPTLQETEAPPRIGKEARAVSCLFVRVDSVYKTMAGVDAYDIRRDARRFKVGPIVAHPPCRSWSSLRALANPRPGERWLAPWSALQVQRRGGVLEHPKGSLLWRTLSLPRPGEPVDRWGGFTIEVDQFHWGHRARKRTWLYIVGTEIIPAMPVRSGEPTHCITQTHGARKGAPGFKSRVPDWEREATPPAFARWLVELARTCRPEPDPES